MKKFMVCSGFLGAGKTTTMMALQKRFSEKYGKAAMISNDVGGKGLVDYRYSDACGRNAVEIAEECICFVTEDLVDCLRNLFDTEGNDLVMSDIPGFGVGALEHVYLKLNDEYKGEFDMAPFTVVIEPAGLDLLIEGRPDPELPKELNCLLDAQLKEADLVILNKCDTITDEEKEMYTDFITKAYPGCSALGISATEETGLDEVIDYLISNTARLEDVDFGIEQETFNEAFGKLSEYNCQYYVQVCCDDFDANDYLVDLGKAIADRLRENDRTTPHLKIFGQLEDRQVCMVNLIGVDRPVSVEARIDKRCIDLAVVINTTSACESDLLEKIMQESIEEVSRGYNLSVFMFFTECFGLMDGEEE
ncbi:MAG: GTPase (G3E family) [Firmicutes bacterium]|nr:GTPase (G3E family) [Bacillota bacterium]